MRVQTKRVYEPPSEEDGLRVLVDRVWPRGKKKADLEIAHWDKDLAPSSDLRKWFGHDPEKWTEFKKRYFEELGQHKDKLHDLLDQANDDMLTLVYSARDRQHNNAVALSDYLKQMKGGHCPSRGEH